MRYGGQGCSTGKGYESPTETELKLLASAASFQRLRAAPLLAVGAREAFHDLQLTSIYFDTGEQLLHRHGLSLRVRSSGDDHIQTVKFVPKDGDLLARNEWEVPVESMAPDIARLRDQGISPLFDTLAEDALVPIFKTQVKRSFSTIEWHGAAIEVAFDEGAIQAGGKQAPISEIELELKSGCIAVLFELGLRLMDLAPLRLGVLSKYQRGFALAFAAAPVVVKATAPILNSSDSVDSAIAKIMTCCFLHIIANLAAADCGSDPEGVHELRVALRRLRVALSIITKEVQRAVSPSLIADAKWLAQSLGPVRNWDVFITETLPRAEKAEQDREPFEAFHTTAVAFRHAYYDALRDVLAGPRANRFLLEIGHFIERQGWREGHDGERHPILKQHAVVVANRALQRVRSKVAKEGRSFGHLRPKARHKLRLTLKSLGDTAAFFRPLYTRRSRVEKFLDDLDKLLDTLGADSDLVATGSLIDKIETRIEGLHIRRGAKKITAWQEMRPRKVAKLLRYRWRRFKRLKPFWSV
jgi:triphosphatase